MWKLYEICRECMMLLEMQDCLQSSPLSSVNSLTVIAEVESWIPWKAGPGAAVGIAASERRSREVEVSVATLQV